MTTSIARTLPALMAAAVLSLPLVSCSGGGEAEGGGQGESETAPKATPVAIESGTHEVRCGCKIEGIGKCGNYVAVGEEWVEISNREELGLDVMEWCRVPADQHVMATVAGTRNGDTIELTELEVQ